MHTLRLAALTMVLAGSGTAQTVPVEPFRSVELRNGGRVIVRHGPVQRVTIVSGDQRSTRVEVEDGQRLLIDNVRHSRDHRLEIEVVTPELVAVSVANGGTVQTIGAFPAQAAVKADVEQGGTIDIRSLAAAAVDASVYSGGGIFTTPRETLTGRVESGGIITYWGDVRVERSVRHGGAVARGKEEDAARPLSEMKPRLPPVPPVPPIPPQPPRLWQ